MLTSSSSNFKSSPRPPFHVSSLLLFFLSFSVLSFFLPFSPFGFLLVLFTYLSVASVKDTVLVTKKARVRFSVLAAGAGGQRLRVMPAQPCGT